MIQQAFEKIESVYKAATAKALFSLVWVTEVGEEEHLTREMAEAALKVYAEAKNDGLQRAITELMQTQVAAHTAKELSEAESKAAAEEEARAHLEDVHAEKLKAKIQAKLALKKQQATKRKAVSAPAPPSEQVANGAVQKEPAKQ